MRYRPRIAADSLQTFSSRRRTQFRQLPFSLDAPALYGISLPLNKSKSKSKTGEPDLDRPARRLPGLNSDSPPAVAWSCEYFAIKAVPPTQHGKRSLRFPDSYFPKPTIPEVTNKDLPTPPPALDRYVLESQGKHLSREERQVIARRLHHKTYTMDLTVVTGKKNIHKLASVRNRIRSKIRHSIRLLVQYGISYDPESGEMLHLTPGPREWLLPGHIYLIVPSLEVYLLPWAMLSSRLATALQAVRVSRGEGSLEGLTRAYPVAADHHVYGLMC